MAVSLSSEIGLLEPVFGTDSLAKQAVDVQFALGEGPGVDAARFGVPVLENDLDGAEALSRWPLFAGAALELGVHAAHAFPLTLGSEPLGSIDLYRRTPGGMQPGEYQSALAIAEVISLGLLETEVDEFIGAGLRMTVHQAAGMVMLQADLSIRDALVLLRAEAFVEDRSVTDLAADVIAGRRRFAKEEKDVRD